MKWNLKRAIFAPSCSGPTHLVLSLRLPSEVEGTHMAVVKVGGEANGGERDFTAGVVDEADMYAILVVSGARNHLC